MTAGNGQARVTGGAGQGTPAPCPDSEVVIRPVRKPDVEAIVALERAVFSEPWSEAAFRTLCDESHVVFRAAVRAGQVVGYVVATCVAEHGEIANLAVAPAARRQRLGALLLGTVLRELDARGARQVFLEVRESNKAARELYARHGFVVIGRRRRYYRRPPEDALVLRRGN